VERFAELPQVIVSPRGGGFSGPTDTALAAHGLRREVVVSASSFLVVLDMVAASDLLALVPERLLHGRSERLRVFEPPLPVEGFSIAMAWHERSHHEPGARWVRDAMRAALASR
jgi:DNA-binding transcriptional LysR family regulator